MTGPRLFRVIVPVGDVDEAARFYGTLLDDEGRRVSGNRHYFDCGGTILACVDARRGAGVELPANPEHLYLAVDDLEAAVDRARAAGAEPGTTETRPWGERSAYLHDPWGNPLCLVAAGTEFTG